MFLPTFNCIKSAELNCFRLSTIPDFSSKYQFSLTQNKIPRLSTFLTFSDLGEFYFPDHFLTCCNHELTILKIYQAKMKTITAVKVNVWSNDFNLLLTTLLLAILFQMTTIGLIEPHQARQPFTRH